MKPLVIAACLAACAFVPCAALAQAACTAHVHSSVELNSTDLFLADLLEPGSCREVLRAARGVRLGSTPLAGSVRVFDGDDIRRMVERILPVSISVPERIRVRRAGSLVSCGDIDVRIPTLGPSPGIEIECGAAGRIARDAPLVLSKPVWDPLLERWQMIARCSHAADCVPFLVQVSGPPSPTVSRGHDAKRNLRTIAVPANEKPLMRPGQIATLLWDQDGIRITGRATCLDRGWAGDWVRARIAPGGRVLRAVIVSAGILRAGS